MSNSEINNPTKEMENVALPLGEPVSKAALLEANGKFRDEILAFKPQELLNECK